MEWFSKKKEETEKKIKVDSGYDIFSADNVGKIAKSLSNMSVLIGDYKEPSYFFDIKEKDCKKKSWNGYEYYTLNNKNTLEFIEKNKDKFGSEEFKGEEFETYFYNLAEYSKINGIKASKGLAALGKKAEDITNSVMNAFTRKEEATFTAASKNNDIVNGSNKLFEPDKGEYFTKVEKTVQKNIINQNLSAFNGEENAPKTVKINGTEFSPQEIAEAMGGGKSLNDFISEKDKLFKQSGKEDKSKNEKDANAIRGRLSEGLTLLSEYSSNLNINKLSSLLKTCEKDFKYFKKYDKANKNEVEKNFFTDLKKLRELEKQIELDQAKVNTYNKLYNGVEGKETNPAKSFDGTDFRDDKNDIVNLNDSNTGFNNVDNPVNAVKNHMANNIKEAKNLEELNKQKDEIEATITLCSNQKTLGENKKSFDSKFNEVQEKLDKTKQTFHDNFNNFNSSINEKSKEEVDNIEVKTSNEAQSKIDELNKKREELIKKVEEEKEAFDKSIEDTESNNAKEKEKIENDIKDIGKDFNGTNITKDSINKIASEIKNVSNSIDPKSLNSDVKTPDFNKDLEEIQKLNKQIENLGKTKNDLKDLEEHKTKAFNNLCSAIKSETEQQANEFKKDKGFCKNGNPVKVREVEKNNLNDNLNQNIKVIFQKKANEIANSKTKSDVDNSMECEENIKETSNLIREASKDRGNFNSFVNSANKRIEQDRKKIEDNKIDKELNEFYDSKLLLNNEVETNEFDSIDTPEDIDKKKQELIDLYKKEYLKNLNEEKEKIEREKKEIDDKESKVGSDQRDKEAPLGKEDFKNLNDQFENLSREINTSYKNVDKLEMDTSRKQEQTREEIEKKLMALASRQQSLSKEKDLKQPEPEPIDVQQYVSRDVQQSEPEENKEGLRVKIFNALNNSIRDGTGIAEKYENGEFRDKDDKKVDLQKVRDVKLLATTTKELNKAYKEGFLGQGDLLAEGEEARKAQEVVLNGGYFGFNADLVKSINEVGEKEKNFFDTKKKIEDIGNDFKEDFEKKYNSISTDNADPKKYDNLSKEDLENEKQKIEEEKQKLKDEYEKIQKEIKEAEKKIAIVDEKGKDIKKYTEESNLKDEDVIKELNEKVKDLNKQLDIDLGIDELESRKQKIEAKMAELAVNEKEIEIAQSQTVSTPQQNTTELNLDDEVKAIANTKENSKDELIDNNVKLEDKCEQIYKQKGIENDKEKKYDVKCEELQKSINKLSDDQKKQYSERMEELIGYSLDMSVDKEKREKIDIDLCEKQRLYITKTKNCDGKVADNIKDAGVGVKVTDLSENYRRTVGQKSVGLVATVEDIDPKEFYKGGKAPKDVDKFNFARFEVESIAEDEKDEYKGYKIDLKLPKDKNTVDIMADTRELGFEKAMEKYKDAGLEINIRDKDGNLLSEDKQKEFFEKLQPKSAEESIGLEEQKQKMNNESLSKEEREKARKEFEEIMKRVEEREKKGRSMDDSEIEPIIKAKEKDPFPKMQNNDMSKTLPYGSNFRVPKSENNNPNQQNGEQNMPENKKSNVRQEITEAMQNEYPGTDSVKTEKNSDVKNISDAKSNAQGLPDKEQDKNQNISKA